MKKIIPVLAVTALLATGCAPSTKVNEKKFNDEVPGYACVLNRNAIYEGEASLGVMTMQFKIETNSDGEKLNLHSTLKYVGDEDVEVDNMQFYLIGEVKENKFAGKMYMYEGSWGVQDLAELPMKELRDSLFEFTYLAPVEYKDTKYDSKEKAYTFDKYTIAVPGESKTMLIRDGKLAFKGGELVSWEYSMSVETETVKLSIERTQKGKVEVKAPTVA